MTAINDWVVIQEMTDAVKAAVAASIDPDLPIAFVDIPFEGDKTQKYIEMVFIPNNDNPRWDVETLYRGIFRLVLHWPNDTGGPKPALELLSSICNYFTGGVWLNRIQLQNEPVLQASLANSAEILYPATLRYQYFPT